MEKGFRKDVGTLDSVLIYILIIVLVKFSFSDSLFDSMLIPKEYATHNF